MHLVKDNPEHQVWRDSWLADPQIGQPQLRQVQIRNNRPYPAGEVVGVQALLNALPGWRFGGPRRREPVSLTVEVSVRARYHRCDLLAAGPQGSLTRQSLHALPGLHTQEVILSTTPRSPR